MALHFTTATLKTRRQWREWGFKILKENDFLFRFLYPKNYPLYEKVTDIQCPPKFILIHPFSVALRGFIPLKQKSKWRKKKYGLLQMGYKIQKGKRNAQDNGRRFPRKAAVQQAQKAAVQSGERESQLQGEYFLEKRNKL